MAASARSEGPRFVRSPDGTRIACWVTGRGPPLVLVHGSTADHSRWDPLRPLLEPHRTLWALDRRGRGASGDAADYDLVREVEDAVAVAEEAADGNGPVALFGHSFGALVALEAALRFPRIGPLVLYEPIVLPSPESNGFAERAEALLREGRREAVVELLFRDILGVPEGELAALKAQPAWRVRVGAAHTLPREDRAESTYRFDAKRMAARRAPTLLLLGAQSPAFMQRSTRALEAAMPGARVALLEGQQHMALSAAPRLVADAVVPFLGARGGAERAAPRAR